MTDLGTPEPNEQAQPDAANTVRPPPIPSTLKTARPLHEDSSLTAIVFVMSSGAEIAVSHVTLWPQDLLDKAAALLNQAGSLNSGFSTGLFFIGPLGSVVTRSLLLGAVEGAVSLGMQAKAGTLQLQAARIVSEAARTTYLTPVQNIANIEMADPITWAGTYLWDSGAKRSFVHSGQAAIHVRTVDGTTRRLIWGAVEQMYAVREVPPSG